MIHNNLYNRRWSSGIVGDMRMFLLLIAALSSSGGWSGSWAFQPLTVIVREESKNTRWRNKDLHSSYQHHHYPGPAALFADSNAHSSNHQLEDGNNDDDNDDDDDEEPKAYGNRSLSWTKRYRQLLPYEYARNRVMSWGLRTPEEYQAERKGPYLPRRPEEMYASEWISWDEFLGVMRSYDEARYLVRCVLQLPSMDAYQAFVQADRKRAEGLRIPAKPDIVYKDKGWISCDHFFGWKTKLKKDEEDDMDVESRFA